MTTQKTNTRGGTQTPQKNTETKKKKCRTCLIPLIPNHPKLNKIIHFLC